MDDCLNLYTWISKNISSEKNKKLIKKKLLEKFFFKFYTVFLNT